MLNSFPSPMTFQEKYFHCETLQDRKDSLKAQLGAFEAFIRTEELRRQGELFHLLNTTISLQGSQLLPLRIDKLKSFGQFPPSLPPHPPRVWQKVFEIAALGILHSGLRLHL